MSFVYIAGRYGDRDGFLAIEGRINRAREHASRLAMAGIPYYSPHLNSAHFEAVVPDVPLEFWQKQDGAFLPKSAAILVILYEWSESKGTRAEVEQAHDLGIPVYFTPEIDKLIKWWNETDSERREAMKQPTASTQRKAVT